MTFFGYVFFGLGSGLALTLGMIFLSTCSALLSSGDGCARRVTPTAEDVVEGGTDFFVGSLLDGIGLLFSFGQRLGGAIQCIVDRPAAGAQAIISLCASAPFAISALDPIPSRAGYVP